MRLRFWPFSEIARLRDDGYHWHRVAMREMDAHNAFLEQHNAALLKHEALERRHADLIRVLNADTKANEATIARLTAERDSLAENILAALTEDS